MTALALTPDKITWLLSEISSLEDEYKQRQNKSAHPVDRESLTMLEFFERKRFCFYMNYDLKN